MRRKGYVFNYELPANYSQSDYRVAANEALDILINTIDSANRIITSIEIHNLGHWGTATNRFSVLAKTRGINEPCNAVKRPEKAIPYE